MSLIVSIFVLILCFILLYQLSRGAAFVPSHKHTVERMVELAEIKPGMKVADLGSGDGRIVIAMAKAGARVVGFEHNPLLAWWGRRNIRKAGVGELAQIKIADFWGQDLQQFDVVVLFGIDYIMKKLGAKLGQELKPGSLVISNAFRFENLNKIKSEFGLNVYKI